MHTGKAFKIFQDKNDIKWGQKWKERLEGTLLSVTFLIPIITPSYFNSKSCREEFDRFLLREKQLGDDRLILPIYYLHSDVISDSIEVGDDAIAKVVASRNWADWRSLRFLPITDADVGRSIAAMAESIKRAMKEIEAVIEASKLVPPPPPPPPPESGKRNEDFLPFVPALRYGAAKTFLRTKDLDLERYYAYTKIYDEEIHAEDLSSKDELTKLSRYVKSVVSRVSTRDGGVISEFAQYLSKCDGLSDFSVSILVDNSGSMRGEKIINSACWAYIVSEMLDKFEISVEVLGYTTKAWKGGFSRVRWQQDGSPQLPGRLNDIRHIIYKDFSKRFSDASRNFSLMTRDGILKENIDGEALLWACERINNFGKKYKLILVISDGAPVDDSTMVANRQKILSSHLRDTSRWISDKSGVDLVAINLEPDFAISMYYDKYIHSGELTNLGRSITSAIVDFLQSNHEAKS